ncbi:hypothetical protein YYC_02182, partial [Plasmodium yoelii 17X]
CQEFKYVESHLPDDYSFDRNKVSTAIRTYCQPNKKPWERECFTIGEVVSAVTILLLHRLFVANKKLESENKNNEYITYVMLWLSNKMKLIKTGSYGSVEDFYVTFIRDSKKYKLYIDKINKNRKIMYLEIYRMRKLYELLNELCNAITKYNNDSSNYSDFSKFVTNWTKQYIQLLLKKPKVFEDEYYCNVLVTLKNAYENFKKDNDTKICFPEIINIEEIKTCKELVKEATSSSKVLKVEFNEVTTKNNLEKGKDTSRHIDLKNVFEIYSSFFSVMFTNIGNSLYGNVMPTLTNFYDKLKNFSDITINYVNELKKKIETHILDNSTSEEKIPRCELPTSQESPSEPSSPSGSKEQIVTSQLSTSTSEKGNLDQKDQGGSQNPVLRPVMKPENAVSEVAGGGTTEIGDNPFNVYKKMGIPILILLIPIALAIMYKVNKKKNVKYTIFKIFPHYKILYIFHNFMLVFAIWMEKEIEEKKKDEKGYKYA